MNISVRADARSLVGLHVDTAAGRSETAGPPRAGHIVAWPENLPETRIPETTRLELLADDGTLRASRTGRIAAIRVSCATSEEMPVSLYAGALPDLFATMRPFRRDPCRRALRAHPAGLPVEGGLRDRAAAPPGPAHRHLPGGQIVPGDATV